MRCQIPLTVFLRSDDLKWFIIPEHGKNDVADFMHDSPDSHVFLLAFAFVGGTPEENAVIAKEILNGKDGAKLDAILLNAGAAIYLASDGITIGEGIAKARKVIKSGKAKAKLEEFIMATN